MGYGRRTQKDCSRTKSIASWSRCKTSCSSLSQNLSVKDVVVSQTTDLLLMIHVNEVERWTVGVLVEDPLPHRWGTQANNSSRSRTNIKTTSKVRLTLRKTIFFSRFSQLILQLSRQAITKGTTSIISTHLVIEVKCQHSSITMYHLLARTKEGHGWSLLVIQVRDTSVKVHPTFKKAPWKRSIV